MNQTTVETLRAKLHAKRESVAYLKELFESMTLGFIPTDGQFMHWLNRYDVEIVSRAIERTAEWLSIHQQHVTEKLEDGKISQSQADTLFKTETDVIRYASGCMKKMQETAEAA